MRLLLLSILCLFNGLLLVGQENFTSPDNYLKTLNEEHQRIQDLSLDYLKYAVQSKSTDFVISRRETMSDQLKQAMRKVGQFPAYKEDSALKGALLNTLMTYRSTYNTQLKQVNELKADSQESYANMEAYLNNMSKAEASISEAAQIYRVAIDSFAKRHNIKDTDVQTSNKIAELQSMNAYYRTAFLYYFKVAKADVDFTTALKNQDLDAAKNALTALQSSTQTAVDSLQTMPAFKENVAYKDSTMALVSYYKELANKEYPEIITMMEKPTQEAADAERMTAIGKKIGEELPPLMKQYELASAQFLHTFMPKPTPRPVEKPKDADDKE